MGNQGLKERVKYLDADALFQNVPETLTILADTERARQLQEEREGPLDPDVIRSGEDWSYLSQRVIGQEERSQTFY